MNNPKISIVTVVYNNVSTVARTIEDTLQQTYQNLEYVVVDGASTDGTINVIKQYNDRLQWISEPDHGIYDAMMKGVLMASGEWVLFRNVGDFFYTDTCIEEVFSRYEDNGEDFIACDIRFFRKGYYKDAKPEILNKDKFAAMPFFHPSTFIRRKTQLKYPFNLRYKNCADYDFFLHCLRDGATYKYIDITLSLFDCNVGASVDHGDRRLLENIEILKSYGAPYKYIDYRIRSLQKLKRNQKYNRFILYRWLYEWNFVRSGKWIKFKNEIIM